MIHYHGGPITPDSLAAEVWTGRHAFVSYRRPDQLPLAAEVSQSFALDNGAYSFWMAGEPFDFQGYSELVLEWRGHPAFEFAIAPDAIDGTEEENDRLLRAWTSDVGRRFDSVPVWHIAESLERLERLVSEWPRVALGSSGIFRRPGSPRWWGRIHEAMGVACDGDGRPRCKLHGLRMLDPTIFSHLPLASADSTSVARNVGLDSRWRGGSYQPLGKKARAAVLLSRIESHASASRYTGSLGVQKNFDLIG